MPRRLLRDGRVVDDEWTYLAEIAADGAAPSRDTAAASGIILACAEWSANRSAWLAHPGRLGVMLAPADRLAALAPDLARFDLVGAQFPGPSEGRGYSHGRLLRERYGFRGELRAAGYVRHDQLFFLARCGFNSFELAAQDLATAVSAFSTFSAEYQPSNDAGLALKLRHR